MTDIILQGICGRMGHALIEKISQREDCRVVAGIDQQAGKVGDIPVYASLDDLPVRGVVIDFSSPAGSVSAAKYCAEHGMPCVICSTGLGNSTVLDTETGSSNPSSNSTGTDVYYFLGHF